MTVYREALAWYREDGDGEGWHYCVQVERDGTWEDDEIVLLVDCPRHLQDDAEDFARKLALHRYAARFSKQAEGDRIGSVIYPGSTFRG